MSFKTSDRLQRQAIDAVMRCLRSRKLPAAREVELIMPQLQAIDDRLRIHEEAEYARKRQREAIDCVEVMGGGD